MSRGTYAALGVLQTPHGRIIVRRTYARKQGSYILTLDGPHDALRLVRPSWKPRSPTSHRTQLSPNEPLRTKTQATSWFHELLPELLHNIEHPPDQQVTPDYRTFAEAIEVVTESMHQTLRPSTLTTYQQQWTTLQRYLPGDSPLITMTRDRLQNAVNQLVKDGYAPVTVHNLATALGRVLGRVVEDGILSANPLDRVNLPKIVEKPPRHLDRAQRVRLLQVAEEAGRDAHLLIACGVYLGLRKAELLALRWGHVSLPRRIVTVTSTPDFTTKSARTRVVPICDDLLLILKRYGRGPADQHVIAPEHQNAGRYRWDFRKTFRRLTEAAGVPWLTVHGLRHSYASLLAQSGVSLFKIRVWLGHASVSTTEIYTHAGTEWDPDVNRAS